VEDKMLKSILKYRFFTCRRRRIRCCCAANSRTSESICKRFRCSSSPKMAAKKNFAKKINKYETANFSRYRNLKQR
jgi:hypothetical protein